MAKIMASGLSLWKILVNPSEIDMKGNVILVVGGEKNGISEQISQSDEIIRPYVVLYLLQSTIIKLCRYEAQSES